MKKEILITGIICLFIGVGIQPAFANENISINRTSSENIEDCNCQDADNYDIVRVKSLLNKAERMLKRVEIFTKLIPILSKNNPEVIEDCEELSNRINAFKEINERPLLSPKVICYALEAMELMTFLMAILIFAIAIGFEDLNLNRISNIIWQIGEIFWNISNKIFSLYIELDCGYLP